MKVPPTVKTSLSPGSRVVTEYFNKAGLNANTWTSWVSRPPVTAA